VKSLSSVVQAASVKSRITLTRVLIIVGPCVGCPDRIRTRLKGQRKSPAALAAGLEFLFFSKEVTANWITGDRVFFYYYWIRIFLFLLLFFFWRLNPVTGR